LAELLESVHFRFGGPEDESAALARQLAAADPTDAVPVSQVGARHLEFVGERRARSRSRSSIAATESSSDAGSRI